MPALLLTLLKVIFVVIIYLFVWQVARALASHTGVADRLPRHRRGRGLVVVRSDSQSGLEIDVRDAVVMGRSQDADIVLDDPYASEFHFRVLAQDERMVLHDPIAAAQAVGAELRHAEPTVFSTSSRVFGIFGVSTSGPSSVHNTSSSIRMPPKPRPAFIDRKHSAAA